MALIPADLYTSIEVVEAAGYDVLALWAPRITAFLNQGHTVEELVAKFSSVSLRPDSIVAIENIDMPPGPGRDELIGHCRRMCEVAQAIKCPNIQMVAGAAFSRAPWPTIRKETARGLRELADIAAEHGLTVAYEQLAWMPVRSLEQTLEVMSEANRPNVRVLVDTFQAYAGGGELETIRNLDKSIVAGVHLGDAAPCKLGVWSDDDRYAMPGDGIVPLRKTMKAIRDTGFDGVVTDEISPRRYSYWSRLRLAETVKGKGDAVLASL